MSEEENANSGEEIQYGKLMKEINKTLKNLDNI